MLYFIDLLRPVKINEKHTIPWQLTLGYSQIPENKLGIVQFLNQLLSIFMRNLQQGELS